MEHVKDHSGKDSKFHLFTYSVETNQKTVTVDDFKSKEKVTKGQNLDVN